MKENILYEWSSQIDSASSGSPTSCRLSYFPGSSTSPPLDNVEGNGGAESYISRNKIAWEKNWKSLVASSMRRPRRPKLSSTTTCSVSQLAAGKGSQIGTVHPTPCLLSMHTRNHMDITTPVKPEVPRVANYHHKGELILPI